MKRDFTDKGDAASSAGENGAAGNAARAETAKAGSGKVHLKGALRFGEVSGNDIDKIGPKELARMRSVAEQAKSGRCRDMDPATARRVIEVTRKANAYLREKARHIVENISDAFSDPDAALSGDRYESCDMTASEGASVLKGPDFNIDFDRQEPTEGVVSDKMKETGIGIDDPVLEVPLKPNVELRKRIEEDGVQTLSNEELISLLLNQSSRYSCPKDAARILLESNDGSLLGVADRSLKELMMIPGIGIYRGVTIQAIFELARRLRNEIPRPKPVVISAQSAFELLRTDFQDLNHEESWVLFLNRANGLISKERVSMGGVSATTLDPRIIVKRAVDLLASSFIIAHNHPSGNMYPGDVDKKMTVALRQAAALFNITLLDHLIVAGNKFFSFSDEGL